MSSPLELKGDRYRVAVQSDPLVPEETVPPFSGGRVTFSGIVRPTEDGRLITGIDYNAYSEMALKSLESIVKDTIGIYGNTFITAVHRTGFVGNGEASVLVDVFDGHRANAFKACSLVIDRIKTEVPVWKNIVYKDGKKGWKEGQHNVEPLNSDVSHE